MPVSAIPAGARNRIAGRRAAGEKSDGERRDGRRNLPVPVSTGELKMSIDLSGVLTSVGSLLGSNASAAQPLATQIIQQVAVGAAASGFLAALSHPDVKAAMLPFDPLNLAGKSLT